MRAPVSVPALLLASLLALSGAGLPTPPQPAVEAGLAPGSPSLAAAVADLGAATGHPLAAEDASRIAAFEARLAPAAAGAIAELATAVASASRARPLGEAGGPGDAATLAAAGGLLRAAQHRAADALRGLECLLDCAQATAACAPVLGCLPGSLLCRPPAIGIQPNCACPPGDMGTPPACTSPPSSPPLPPRCPPGQAGTPPGCVPLPVDLCAGLPMPFTVPLLLSIGTAAAEGFQLDVALSVDFGGNDAYCNNAGSTFSAGPPHGLLPRCSGEFTPVALLLELDGNDHYHTPVGPLETDTEPLFCFEGSSLLGIALLQDLAGDDAYNSDHFIFAAGAPGFCAPLPGRPALAVPSAHYVALATQGATFGGLGSLEDLGGNDRYNSDNTVCTRYYSEACLVIHLAQGAAAMASGQGVMREAAGDDAYNSRNQVLSTSASILPALPGVACLSPLDALLDLPQTSRKAEALLLVRDVQGAALQGVGELRDEAGDDHYNSLNEISREWALAQQPALPARLLVECAQGCGSLGGEGRHLDGGGADRYNADNKAGSTNAMPGALLGIRCVQGVTAEGLPAPLESGCIAHADACDTGIGCGDCAASPACPPEGSRVPATPETTVGMMEELGGDDHYNSGNTVAADHDARLLIQQAQGSSEGGLGGLYEDSGADCLNCGNSAGWNAATPGGRAILAIEAVQGSARSHSGTGAMAADAGAPSNAGAGDDYNGANQATGTPAALRITYAQASSSAPPGSLAVGRLRDHAGDDKYNAANLAGAGLMEVLGAQAALGKAALPAHGGAVVYQDDDGADQYNALNTCGGGACVDWVGCVASAPSVAGMGFASFLDRRLVGVDTWAPLAPAFAQGMYNTGLSALPAGNCRDMGDGAELPAGHGFGVDT